MLYRTSSAHNFHSTAYGKQYSLSSVERSRSDEFCRPPQQHQRLFRRVTSTGSNNSTSSHSVPWIGAGRGTAAAGTRCPLPVCSARRLQSCRSCGLASNASESSFSRQISFSSLYRGLPSNSEDRDVVVHRLLSRIDGQPALSFSSNLSRHDTPEKRNGRRRSLTASSFHRQDSTTRSLYHPAAPPFSTEVMREKKGKENARGREGFKKQKTIEPQPDFFPVSSHNGVVRDVGLRPQDKNQQNHLESFFFPSWSPSLLYRKNSDYDYLSEGASSAKEVQKSSKTHVPPSSWRENTNSCAEGHHHPTTLADAHPLPISSSFFFKEKGKKQKEDGVHSLSVPGQVNCLSQPSSGEPPMPPSPPLSAPTSCSLHETKKKLVPLTVSHLNEALRHNAQYYHYHEGEEEAVDNEVQVGLMGKRKKNSGDTLAIKTAIASLPPSLRTLVNSSGLPLTFSQLELISTVSPSTRYDALRMMFEGVRPADIIYYILNQQKHQAKERESHRHGRGHRSRTKENSRHKKRYNSAPGRTVTTNRSKSAASTTTSSRRSSSSAYCHPSRQQQDHSPVWTNKSIITHPLHSDQSKKNETSQLGYTSMKGDLPPQSKPAVGTSSHIERIVSLSVSKEQIVEHRRKHEKTGIADQHDRPDEAVSQHHLNQWGNHNCIAKEKDSTSVPDKPTRGPCYRDHNRTQREALSEREDKIRGRKIAAQNELDQEKHSHHVLVGYTEPAPQQELRKQNQSGMERGSPEEQEKERSEMVFSKVLSREEASIAPHYSWRAVDDKALPSDVVYHVEKTVEKKRINEEVEGKASFSTLQEREHYPSLKRSEIDGASSFHGAGNHLVSPPATHHHQHHHHSFSSCEGGSDAVESQEEAVLPTFHGGGVLWRRGTESYWRELTVSSSSDDDDEEHLPHLLRSVGRHRSLSKRSAPQSEMGGVRASSSMSPGYPACSNSITRTEPVVGQVDSSSRSFLPEAAAHSELSCHVDPSDTSASVTTTPVSPTTQVSKWEKRYQDYLARYKKYSKPSLSPEVLDSAALNPSVFSPVTENASTGNKTSNSVAPLSSSAVPSSHGEISKGTDSHDSQTVSHSATTFTERQKKEENLYSRSLAKDHLCAPQVVSGELCEPQTFPPALVSPPPSHPLCTSVFSSTAANGMRAVEIEANEPKKSLQVVEVELMNIFPRFSSSPFSAFADNGGESGGVLEGNMGENTLSMLKRDTSPSVQPPPHCIQVVKMMDSHIPHAMEHTHVPRNHVGIHEEQWQECEMKKEVKEGGLEAKLITPTSIAETASAMRERKQSKHGENADFLLSTRGKLSDTTSSLLGQPVRRLPFTSVEYCLKRATSCIQNDQNKNNNGTISTRDDSGCCSRSTSSSRHTISHSHSPSPLSHSPERSQRNSGPERDEKSSRECTRSSCSRMSGSVVPFSRLSTAPPPPPAAARLSLSSGRERISTSTTLNSLSTAMVSSGGGKMRKREGSLKQSFSEGKLKRPVNGDSEKGKRKDSMTSQRKVSDAHHRSSQTIHVVGTNEEEENEGEVGDLFCRNNTAPPPSSLCSEAGENATWAGSATSQRGIMPTATETTTSMRSRRRAPLIETMAVGGKVGKEESEKKAKKQRKELSFGTKKKREIPSRKSMCV